VSICTPFELLFLGRRHRTRSRGLLQLFEVNGGDAECHSARETRRYFGIAVMCHSKCLDL
jgi:hypothetical protein